MDEYQMTIISTNSGLLFCNAFDVSFILFFFYSYLLNWQASGHSGGNTYFFKQIVSHENVCFIWSWWPPFPLFPSGILCRKSFLEFDFSSCFFFFNFFFSLFISILFRNQFPICNWGLQTKSYTKKKRKRKGHCSHKQGIERNDIHCPNNYVATYCIFNGDLCALSMFMLFESIFSLFFSALWDYIHELDVYSSWYCIRSIFRSITNSMTNEK